MEAVRYHGPNEALTFETVPIPNEADLTPDEVIVRVEASALCHTEVNTFVAGANCNSCIAAVDIISRSLSLSCTLPTAH